MSNRSSRAPLATWILNPALFTVVLLVLMTQIALASDPRRPILNQDGFSVSRYEYGEITIHGTTYGQDVILVNDTDVSVFAPKEEHYVTPADLQAPLESGATTLIFGAGWNGDFIFPKKTKTYLKSRNIQYHILNTYEAIKLYNRSPKEKVAAIFHLNC